VRYEKIAGKYRVFCDSKGQRDILRALVTAIFELSPFRGSLGASLTAEQADDFIHLERESHRIEVRGPTEAYPLPIADMDYVGDRVCKATLFKYSDGSFTVHLARTRWSQDREVLEILLRGEQIISCTNTYEGSLLDSIVQRYGHSRCSGESDWEFRKRVFPALYPISPERALELLLGSRARYWHASDRVMAEHLFFQLKSPQSEQLRRFAEGFADDPLVIRNGRSRCT